MTGESALVQRVRARMKIRSNPAWEHETLNSYLFADSEVAPMSFVVDGTQEISYTEFIQRVRGFAGFLVNNGVETGDVVTVMLPNWWEALVACHAVLWAGAIVNPIVPIYREHEVSFVLAQARPRMILLPDEFRGFSYVPMLQRAQELANHRVQLVIVRGHADSAPSGAIDFEEASGSDRMDAMAQADPDDPALLLYTSGTTGNPKGVLHTHNTLVYENRSIIDLYALQRGKAIFMPSPVTHITGFLYGVLLPVMLGAPVVLQDVWDPIHAVDLVEMHACQFSLGATPFLQGLFDAYQGRPEFSRSALAVFPCGGAPVPPDLVLRARERMGTDIVRVYGSSEFPTFCSGRRNEEPDIASQTEGRPIGPVVFRLENSDHNGVGELVVNGPELFAGYFDMRDEKLAFTEDGLFKTGDLARLFDEINLVICGRSKDIVIRKGENISAREIEDLLFEHDDIAEVAVVGVPDVSSGERVVAFIVAKSPDSLIRLEAIAQFLGEKGIARQKIPEQIEHIDELPKTPSGKVKKFVLRDLATSHSS